MFILVHLFKSHVIKVGSMWSKFFTYLSRNMYLPSVMVQRYLVGIAEVMVEGGVVTLRGADSDLRPGDLGYGARPQRGHSGRGCPALPCVVDNHTS